MARNPNTIRVEVYLTPNLHRRFKAAAALDASPSSKSMHSTLTALVTRYTEHQETLNTRSKPSNQHYHNAAQ